MGVVSLKISSLGKRRSAADFGRTGLEERCRWPVGSCEEVSGRLGIHDTLMSYAVAQMRLSAMGAI